MTNRVTKAEREALITRATELLHQDPNGNQVEAQLAREGVSKQRARHAVAKVRLRENRPK